jgi:hypothetical protein
VKIAHVGLRACDRMAVYSHVQMKMGHHVTVIHPDPTPECRDSEKWEKGYFNEIVYCPGWDVPKRIKSFDLVMLHHPQYWPMVNDHPNLWVDIHDCYLADGLNVQPFELQVVLGAKKAVFVSDGQRILCQKVSGRRFKKDEYLIRPNVPSRDWIVSVDGNESPLDGRLHVVYEGGTGDNKGHHRYFLPLFQRISGLKDVKLHLYCPFSSDYYRKWAISCKSVVWHERVGWKELPGELKKYDVTLAACCFPCDTPMNCATAIPGKLGYACAVGTPSIVESRMLEAISFAEGLCVPVSWDQLSGGSDSDLMSLLVCTASKKMRENSFWHEAEDLDFESPWYTQTEQARRCP